MTVADTSRIAYQNHKSEGKVGLQANHILNLMQGCKDYSRRELATLCGIDLSSVCGRVNELVQIKLLKEAPKRKCKLTGKTIVPVYKDSLF